ncbi:MAG TPA: hypothetical protein VFP61_05415 [Acidimicrobiales bacterium]|nr:hypothetical protein [Acidimicrobiales bacterium]
MSSTAQHLRRSLPASAPDAGRPDLRVVERPGRRLALPRGRAAVVTVFAGLAAVMLGLVYLHVVLAQRQIELDRLTARTAAAEQHYQALRLQVAQLESPGRIIATAEGRLGMRPPATVHYVSPPPQSPSPTAAPSPASGPAPAGDADWPAIKAALAGQR